MTDGQLLILILVLVILGPPLCLLVAIWLWSRLERPWARRLDQQRRRRVLGGPVSSIGSAAGPFVRIRGRVAASATLRAPLSERACVAYQVILETRASATPCESRGFDFLLRDESGACRVRSEAVILVRAAPARFPVVERAAYAGRLHLPTDQTALLLETGATFVESLLAPGDEVFIAGRTGGEPDREAEGAYRETATRLVLSGDDAAPLHISDDLRPAP